VELARFASIPVINGLTDLLHPCQVLADVMTVEEALGSIEGKVVAWIGDGNNMANSWLNAAAVLGFELRLACPEGYEPNHDIFAFAKSHTNVTITEDVEAAMRGAHVVNTDVWASMGEEDRIPERIALLKPYKVTPELMERTGRDEAIFLHCLPAFHSGATELERQFPDIGEVSDEVFEGPRSRVFDEAEQAWLDACPPPRGPQDGIER